jgi:mono/diheme cytochrome c family protein
MKHAKYILAVFVFDALAAAAVPPSEEGKAIFTSRCAACHNLNKVLTGPALAGVHERRSMDWIVSFVRSSQSMVKQGDQQAVALFEQFNKIPMPDHTDLTEENIVSIVSYIRESGSQAVQAPFAKPSRLHPVYLPLSLQEDYGFFLGFFAIVGLLIVVLLFAVQVQQYSRAMRGDE